MNLKIIKDRVTTIRELSPGTHFIQMGHFRSAISEEDITYHVRLRTDDPYRSRTLLGTRIRTFPSEKAFAVEVKP
jgi:hypothetical protein